MIYSYSLDNRKFFGAFSTWDEALAMGMSIAKDKDAETLWVREFSPVNPTKFDAAAWLESCGVTVNDDLAESLRSVEFNIRRILETWMRENLLYQKPFLYDTIRRYWL